MISGIGIPALDDVSQGNDHVAFYFLKLCGLPDLFCQRVGHQQKHKKTEGHQHHRVAEIRLKDRQALHAVRDKQEQAFKGCDQDQHPPPNIRDQHRQQHQVYNDARRGDAGICPGRSHDDGEGKQEGQHKIGQNQNGIRPFDSFDDQADDQARRGDREKQDGKALVEKEPVQRDHDQ